MNLLDYLDFRFVPNAAYRIGKSHETTEHYDLFFVEIDDQGWYYDQKQCGELFAHLEKVTEHVLFVVFVHGWKHNAAEADENVANFRTLLIATRDGEVKRPDKRRRPVIGIYLSWRGSATRNPVLNQLSFWTRKSAATRVALGSVREVLGRLRQAQKQLNARLHGEQQETQMIILGHSFGGLILFSAIAEYLIESAISPHIIRPFGDVIILLNPAFEAARYQPIATALGWRRKYRNLQRPVLISITADNDVATKRFFPLGRWVNSFFERVRDVQIESLPVYAERQAIRNTIGHLKWLQTHRLEAKKTDKNQGGFTGRASTYDEETGSFQEFNRLWRNPDGSLKPHWERRYSAGAILTHQKGDPNNPFWCVTASPDVIDGHNGIFKHVLLDFVRQLCDDRLRSIPGFEAHVDHAKSA